MIFLPTQDARRRALTALATLILACLLPIVGAEEAAGGAETSKAFKFRGIWVNRFAWSEPADIARILSDCAELGLTDVIWQVRGEGTALYHSDIEPLHERLSGDTFPEDPLALAVREAHERGLRLHAWINTLPGWHGSEPSRDPTQLWNAHPDWFMGTRDWNRPDGLGSKTPELGSGYVFLDPALAEVRAHLASVVAELAEHYDLDGIHFDYIRYPGPDYGYSVRSISLAGINPHRSPGRWNEWRREQLTSLLSEAVTPMRDAHPRMLFSAATWGNESDGRQRFLQDQHTWLALGLLDFTCPMIYTTDPDSFALLAREHLWNQRGRRSIPGIGSYLFDGKADLLATELSCLETIGADGFVLYDYGSLTGEKADDERALLAERKAANAELAWPWVAERLSADAPPSPRPVIDQVLSDSPVFRSGRAFRMGARVRDDQPVGPRIELTLLMPEAPRQPPRSFPMNRITPADRQIGVYVTDPLPALADDSTYLLFAETGDGYAPTDRVDTPVRARSEVTRVRTVQPVSAYVTGSLFGRPIEGPQSPLAVDTRVWVCAEEENAVLVFNEKGREVRFSPIRYGLIGVDTWGELERPAGLVLDTDGDVLVLAMSGGASYVFRFTKAGEGKVGWKLPFVASSMARDAAGHLYVTEAYRRRWHLLTHRAEPIAGPFGAFDEGEAAREAPSLYRGIATTADGTRVFVANPTNRRVDIFERVENTDGTTSMDFRFVAAPLCEIGWETASLQTTPDGRILVCDGDHFIRIFSPKGEPLGDIWSDTPPLRSPRGVAFTNWPDECLIASHGGGDRVGSIIEFREPGFDAKRHLIEEAVDTSPASPSPVDDEAETVREVGDDEVPPTPAGEPEAARDDELAPPPALPESPTE